ncbi:MAG: hypothetical protein ACKO6N_14435 [Myxococcota bacterium]
MSEKKAHAEELLSSRSEELRPEVVPPVDIAPALASLETSLVAPTCEGESAFEVLDAFDTLELPASASSEAHELLSHVMAALLSAAELHGTQEDETFDFEDDDDLPAVDPALAAEFEAEEFTEDDLLNAVFETLANSDDPEALEEPEAVSGEALQVPLAMLDAVLRFQNLLETPTPRGELARLLKRMVEARRDAEGTELKQAMQDFQETSTFLELATQHDDERSHAQRRAEAQRLMDNMIWRVDFADA